MVNTDTKVFVFDVDGVIVDSTEECLVTAWNAYQNYKGLNNYIYSTAEADDEYCSHFRSIRNYVRTMDEYLVVFRSFPGEIDSQKQFEAKVSQLDEIAKKRYADQFLSARNKLKKKDMSNWIKLHCFYPKIKTILERAVSRHPFYIVTGKDRESVSCFFKVLNIKISDSQIFDRDIARSKLSALQHIAQLERVKNEHIYFIDDNVTHLIDPLREGFSVFLVSWGYGMLEHFELARRYKIPVVSQDDILKLYEEL